MVRTQRRRIALLFAGGTQLTAESRAWERVAKPADVDRWLSHVPELQVIADLEPVFVTGKPAGAIGPDEWLALAAAVRTAARTVDGVVVIHGLESINYTAAALSLMCRSLPFPVVLTGSSPTAATAQLGMRTNLINALEVATADLAGVCVVFGNRIMRGSRVELALLGDSLQATTDDGALLGRIDFGTRLANGRLRRGARKPRWDIHLDPGVAVMAVAPGVAPMLRGLDERPVRGLLLRLADDVVSLPPAIQTAARKAAERGTIVAAWASQPIRDLPAGCVSLVGMTASMALVKLMWAAGSKKPLSAKRALLARDVSGELGAQRAQ